MNKFLLPTDEQVKQLIDAGYKKKVFFFAIGGGEDEDDIDIYVDEIKDIAVTWDIWHECWKQTKYSELSYVNGFPLDEADTFRL